MTEFGFKKPEQIGARKAKDDPKPAATVNVSGLKTQPIEVNPILEREAVTRGEDLGFVDRGQGGVVRRNRKAQPSASLYVKGPVETIQWFIRYTESRGYSAYWNSLQDFREMIERGEGEAPGGKGAR
jgi:hypothetical protein